MTDFDQVNFLMGTPELVADPTPYYDHLRGQCPVHPVAALGGVFAVTGHEELLTIQRDVTNYSSANCLAGMFPPFEMPDGVDDLGPYIEAARASAPPELSPIANLLVALDPPVHTDQRALLKRIFSPKRLAENEVYMAELANQMLDDLSQRGSFDVMHDFAWPFTTLIIAELLGVPVEDRQLFAEKANLGQVPLETMGQDGEFPLAFIEGYFTRYIEDRRVNPRDDFLTLLAESHYPDGSLPAASTVSTIASFMFAAAGDTTSGLICAAMRLLCEEPGLQDRLRANPDLIPDFIEETLRLEGSTKSTFRLARRATTVPTDSGEVDIPIGSAVMLLLNAANRDPRRFEHPNEFDLDRGNSREHVAFGRGPHACAGAPLARAEARVAFRTFIDRLAHIELSEEHHGPKGDRRFEYEYTSVLRKLLHVHVVATPCA